MADSNQQQDPENLQDAEAYQAGREPTAGRANPEGATDESYDPSTVQVNRGREQGLGVGQKDLDYQRDPTGFRSAEQHSFAPNDGVVQHAQGGEPAAADQAGPPGKERDEDYDNRGRDQIDTDWPAG